MKKILLLALVLCVSYSANTQNVAFIEDNPSSMLYTLPRTSLKIRVVATHQTIRKGVYARFAQKYLGVIAPLSDKDIYSVSAASIVGAVESDPTQVYVVDASKPALSSLIKQSGNLPMPVDEPVLRDRFGSEELDNQYDYTDLGLSPLVKTKQANGELASDLHSAKPMSLEQMAASAADAIFTLRQRRFELITGESSENVFGAGLAAAIDEMRRIELDYITLFMGKTTETQIVKEYELVPEKDKFSYVVCRFSPAKGLVDATDLSASPLVLELTPEKFDPKIELPRVEAPANPKEVLVQDLFKYRVACVANCKLSDGTKTLVTNRIPIYQYGYIVDIPVNIQIKKL